MKYFVKYLPAKGEIKDGDLVEADGVVWTYNSKRLGSPLYDQFYEKVKLFLCSRDIQVGEKARTSTNPEKEFIVSKIEMGSGENYYPKELLVWFDDEERKNTHYWFELSKCFKVIGEISPEAKWVKEGDEFSEKEIRYKDSSHGNDVLISTTYWDWKGWNPEGEVFAILGPCNHFH